MKDKVKNLNSYTQNTNFRGRVCKSCIELLLLFRIKSAAWCFTDLITAIDDFKSNSNPIVDEKKKL